MKRTVFLLPYLAILSGCLLTPGKKPAIEDDFLEPVTLEEKANVSKNIAELKKQISDDFNNAELHRRLSIYYRLLGTPRSRLLSLEEIDKTIELDPRNPRNYVEKGVTMLARRFIGEAEKSFKRAAKIAPKYFEAWYQLGRMEQEEYLKMMCFPNHLKKAVRYFQKAYRLNRQNKEVLMRLGLLHMFRCMYRTAEKYASKATIYYPEDPRTHLLLGVTRVFLKKFEESEGEFSKAFELMRDEERTPYEDISSLLPPDMKELYLTSTTEKKIEWNRKFWAESDPTPSTEINERRIEHYKRVFLANALLTNKRLGLKGEETHRGKALIRYGLPHKKYFDLASGLVGPWLIWRYEFPHLAFNLYFQDEFLNGNFHIPIKEKILGKKTAQLMENIPQNYEFPIKYKLLPICVKSAQTRCIGEKTRLEFSIGITNSILKSEKGDWDLFLTFFDQDWNRISNDHFMFRPDTLLNIDKLGERFAVINFWLELLPRPIGCVCVLEIIHDSSKYKGVCRYPLEIRNLFGRSLKLSSIKFTVPDIDGTCSNVLDPIPVYGNFETLCLSYQIYNLKRDENNLSRYRLTYIIKNPEDREEENTGIRKTLSYMWKSIRGRKNEKIPYIKSTLEQSINERTADDKLQIDLSAIDIGRYLLILEVEDLNSGEVVSGSNTFLITDQTVR